MPDPEWNIADKIASASGEELRELAKNLSPTPHAVEGGPDHSVRQVMAEAREEARHAEVTEPEVAEPEGDEPVDPGGGDGGTSTAPPATISLEHETDPVLVRKAAASLRRG